MEKEPSFPSVAMALRVTVALFAAVHAVSQLSIVAFCAEDSVTVLERFVQVAVPIEDGAELFAILITSPGAILAADAPVVIVFQASVQLIPQNGTTSQLASAVACHTAQSRSKLLASTTVIFHAPLSHAVKFERVTTAPVTNQCHVLVHLVIDPDGFATVTVVRVVLAASFPFS